VSTLYHLSTGIKTGIRYHTYIYSVRAARCDHHSHSIVAHVSAPPSPLTTFSSILQITFFYAIILGDVNELKNQIVFKNK